MQRAKHRFFDNDGRRSGGEMAPYFFQRNTADVLDEAFRELMRLRLMAAAREIAGASLDRTEDEERAVLREQRRTLFEFDAGMRRVFHNDFEAFEQALDDPARMEERLQERQRTLEAQTAADAAAEQAAEAAMREESSSSSSEWNDLQSPVRQWEQGQPMEICSDPTHNHNGDMPADEDQLAKDPVYDAAFRWACEVERWAREHYFNAATKDRDCFRASVNVLLVPAKVAFAEGTETNATAALEVAAIGYRQASIFCSRTLDALGNCYGKHIGREEDVHQFLDDGRELLADLQSRLAELEEEITKRRTQ